MSTTSGSSPASITSPIDTGDDYFDKGNTSEQNKLPDEETSKDKGNQNGEELDFEEEDNESLEEGEEESDGDEGLTNENNEDRNTGNAGDSKDIKEVQSKSRKKDEDEEDEDGEVNSEEELEEGEVKEDDDSETGGADDEANGQKKPIKKTGNLTSNSNNQAKTSICRFFAKGQCTWGLNCRFLHLAAPVVALPIKLPNQRGFPYQVGLNPTGLHPTGMHPTGIHPTGAHPTGPLNVAHTTGAHPTGHHSIPRPPLNRHQAAALAGTTIHPPHPPSSSQSSSSNTDAAWVRGLRNAKEMLVKANKRKEEESDFEKRFNATAEDEATSHSKHSYHSRESPESGDYGERRSPHSYHAREREKRSHREGNRRDETRDNREARDVREREPRETRDRDNREREPRDEYWNSEYERRRRLAFESAPWNDEQSPPPAPARGNARPREAAEMYRDPWRRSKSPPAKWSGGRRTDVSTASKRSHSLSSISGSESGSELSGSESMSGSSFSGSDVSYSDASEASGRSPREGRLKSKSGKPRSHKDKTRSNPDQSGHHTSSRDRSGTSGQPPPKGAQAREKTGSVHVSKNRSNRSSIDEEAGGSGPRKKSGPVPAAAPISKPRRDSWSDSDSGSMSQSDSSLYSGSESGESDAFSGASDTPLEDDRRTKGYRNRRDAKPHPSSNRQNYDSVRRAPQRSRTSDSPPPPPPPSSSHHSSNPKRMKMSTSASTSSSSNRENNSMKNRHSSTMPSDDLPTSSPQQASKKSLHTPTSPNDGPKKNPIKMTFKKKHSNLRTDRVITAKLSGGKSDEESGEEEELKPDSGDRHQQISHSPRADSDEFDAEYDETDEHDNPRISKKMNDPLIDRNHRDNDGDNFEVEEYENEDDDDNEDGDNGDDNDDDIDDVSLHQKDKQKQTQRISNSSCKSEKSSTMLSTPSTSSSPSPTKNSKDGSSRREHLLKQLEAVEAMIAKKKAKLQ